MARAEETVLRRKVRGPKMRISGFPSMDPFCAALASLSATSSRKELRSGIDVSVFGYEVVRHADYLRLLRAPSAIFLISFDSSHTSTSSGTGLIKAHPRLLSKILDVSLGGDGSFEEAKGSRELTSIDLAIYGRFVDLITRAFDETIKELCGDNPISVPHKTRFEEQPGMIRIAPDKAEIFVIKLNFHIGDDARGSGLDIVVPVTVLEPLKRALNTTISTNEATKILWARHMYDQVMSLPIEANSVISLGEFTVGELSRIKTGMLIELPTNSIDEVQLRVETIDGPHTLTTGRLGSKGRHKALRVAGEVDPDFIKPLLDMPRP